MSLNIDYTKEKFTDEEKLLIQKEMEIVKYKYPDHIPIIVISKNKELKLSKMKYLLGADLTVAQFQMIIRKKLENKLNSTEALYLLVRHKNNGILLQGSIIISDIYNTYTDQDIPMLFIEVCKENTFGKKI